MTRTWLALVAALAVSLSGAARAQETFDSLAGPWWFRIGGKDAGAMLIQFSAPDNGTFHVEDVERTDRSSFGFSRTLGAFFLVEPDQELTFDSKGNVIGALQLSDGDSIIGTLTFEKGKPNKKFNGWKVTASLEGDGEPVVAKLTGKRIPLDFPVLSGGNAASSLSGKGVKSKAFDLHVLSDAELGLPAYAFDGEGPVSIDKVEVPGTTLAGRFILSPKFEVFGLLEDSSAFGTGPVKGKLKLPSNSLVPKVNLTAEADRKVTAKSQLDEPVEPVLSVTPTNFNFGAVHLDPLNPPTKTFNVSNVGIGSLSGSAEFINGDVDDFSILVSPDYTDVTPGDPNEIVVEFSPQSAGDKTAQILFKVDAGAGARIITVNGIGGIPQMSVNVDTIAFDDTTVGQSVFEIITVSNTGDGILEGTATIAGSSDFGLTPAGNNNVIAKVDYTIQPGDNKQIFIRFKPSATGDKTATVTLTGGGGDTVVLTGTGL